MLSRPDCQTFRDELPSFDGARTGCNVQQPIFVPLGRCQPGFGVFNGVRELGGRTVRVIQHGGTVQDLSLATGGCLTIAGSCHPDLMTKSCEAPSVG
jgi:hypothetical protein